MAAASGEDVKSEDETDSSVVDALEPFKDKVKLVLRTKETTTGSGAEGGVDADATTRVAIFMSLTHSDTFSVFEGEFSKEDLVKLKFNPHCPIEADLQIIRDAFYGTQSDVTLECGFVSTKGLSEELQPDYFDGANVLLKIKEVYRGHVLEYRFVLKPKEVSEFERQSKVNAALRGKVDDLSATVAVMKAKQSQAKAEYSREIAGLREETNNEMRTLKAEITKLTSSLKKVESAVTKRTVSFFERITASKARPKGWSNIALNCGHFGEDSAERCSFAQLLDGGVRITADGDYELAAKCAVSLCGYFGMQLVVHGTDGSNRLLDAVGGGNHNPSTSIETSTCHVGGVWLPIAAGTIITMRVYVHNSSSSNTYTHFCVHSEMKDKSMPVSAVSIRKLC